MCAGKYNVFNKHIELIKGALKRKSLNVEECGHEIRNEFHWSQKSRGTQAIIITTQDRTSYVAVTYERYPGLTPSSGWYSYCAAPRSQGVSEMKSWLPGNKRGGARKGSERKQLGEGKRAFAYGKFSLSPTVYQRCIMLKTLQKIISDSEFTAYLVDVAEAFDKTSQSR